MQLELLIIKHTLSEHTKELFNSQKILNIYKLNILNAAIFMHKSHNFSNFFRKSLILIQQGFQNCATRYLKQILLNVNTEFQAEEC